MNTIEELRKAYLGFVLETISLHLQMLDIEMNSKPARYDRHRREVNEMLRPMKFYVTVAFGNRHCIIPLLDGEIMP